jgi:Polyketide cyclase / dehydrase and lipid transport
MTVAKCFLRACVCFVPLALGTSASAVGPENPWSEVRTRGPFTLFNRRVAREPMREFLVKGIVDIKPEELLAIVRDLPNYPLWMVGCDKARLVDSEDPSLPFYRSRIYLMLGAPFPFSDRDLELVVQNKRDETTGNWEFASRALSDEEAFNKPIRGVVRIVKSAGIWRFSRVENTTDSQPDTSRTNIVYQWHSDPAGHIPAWLANRVTETAPLEAMEHLIARAICLRSPPQSNKNCAMQ